MTAPTKYQKALEFINKNDEDGFIAFDATTVLDYDVEKISHQSGSRDSLFFWACYNQRFKCVAHMINKATPHWLDVVRVYGHASDELSQKIWTKYLAANGGVPPTRVNDRRFSDREEPVDLLSAFATHDCHLTLLQKMFNEYKRSPKCYYTDCWDKQHVITMAFIEYNNGMPWMPENFIWLCENFTKKQLGITDEAIGRILWSWRQDQNYVSALEYADLKPDAAERVFWMLEEMHSDKFAFRDEAISLMPSKPDNDGERRLVTMLATLGIFKDDLPEAKKVTETLVKEAPCSRCKGTGKTLALDSDLVHAAKKRRYDAVKTAK